MNDSRFDEFTKALATSTSRRQALKAIAATTLGGILGLSGIGNVFAKPCTLNGHHCKTYLQCCSQFCANGKCTCPPAPACNSTCPCPLVGQTCCNGTCVSTQTDKNNCGACGLVCSSKNGTSLCINGACSISCNSGFFNCDGNAANGCECAGTGCCGSSCQTIHSNGLGQNFFDCAPLGTYNVTQAMEACQAYIAVNPTAGTCTTFICSGSSELIVGTTSSTNCASWAYSGSNVGHVFQGCNFCPSASDPIWT